MERTGERTYERALPRRFLRAGRGPGRGAGRARARPAPPPPLSSSATKSLTDADHFGMIRTAQRRFAPTVIGITRNSDRHQIGMSDRHRRNTQVGKERTTESFQGFFTVIGEEIASKIVFVCSDMWEPYLKLIREKCSEALHILDRFHIVAKMNKALHEVHAGESRRMASEGPSPVLKKSRWVLLMRDENLKIEQRFRPRELLRCNLKTVRAYLLKEAFQQLRDYNSPAWAGKFLDEWRRQVLRSRIEPMKKIARSLRRHRELILNYFRAQKPLSSVVEGLDNKAKVTMRNHTDSVPSVSSNSPSIPHLANYRSPNPSTIFSDEPIVMAGRPS